MTPVRLLSAFLTMGFAATIAAPASEIGPSPSFVVAQQASSPRPSARPPQPRPSARPQPPRPSARPQPPRPTARPQPPRPTVRPQPPRPTVRPQPPRPTSRPPVRPTSRPPVRPTPRPTLAPWRPNRPPNYRPPQTGWQRPPWANQPRPSWARNHGFRPNYILANPRPYAYNWAWNNGAQWSPRGNYWGGGFWGPFALFSLAAGQALWAQNRYASPGYGSPGWYLFQNYGLQPAACGPQNLVYIYGPNNGVMCAYPNEYVLAGFYYVDPATLQLFVM